MFLVIRFLAVSWVLLCLAGCGWFQPDWRPYELGKTEFKRGDAEVMIEGVSCWTPAQLTNSVMAALFIAARVAGEDSIDYDYLMGTSGYAFRLQVEELWSPCAAHPYNGFRAADGALEALPFEVLSYTVAEDDEEGMRNARLAVQESLDRGIPATYGNEEDGLILGYRKKGAEWVCLHPYHDPDNEVFTPSRWPWTINVFKKRKNPAPDRGKCVADSLKLAVEMARTPNRKEFACGSNAWKTWIARLRDDAYFAKASENDMQYYMQGNSWMYFNLCAARASAARYLRANAALLGEASAAHARKAAACYEKMCGKYLYDDSPTVIAPSCNSLEEGEKASVKWTNEMRHHEADLLEGAMEIENEAVAELDAAVKSLP